MFAVAEHPIDVARLRADLQRPDAGALVVFEGWVRNHHRGRPVERLDYEAFAEMAQTEGDAMIADVEREFPGVQIACVHRTGSLAPGDIAVWIGATSAHRDDAFRAARLALEEVKRRLPVWKKEFHPGAEPVWVNCTEDAGVERDAAAYNARQRALPEVGDRGQQAISRASVLVVGVGGLGCPASLYLAGAGVGRLTLVDGGRVELSNLHRQVLFESGDVGAPKASRAAIALRARNPNVRVESVGQDLNAANVRALVTNRSVVLDCTDNFASRLLLHDGCRELGVPLVQAAVHRWEGVLNVFRPGEGGCLYCAGAPRAASELEGVGNCAGAPVFGPAVGTLGLLQAAEALKVLLARPVAEVASERTLLIDLLANDISRIERPRNPRCPHCATATAPRANGVDAGPLWVDEADAPKAGVLVALLTAEEKPGYRGLPPDTPVFHPADTQGVERYAQTNGAIVLGCPLGVRSAAIARALRAAGLQVRALADGLPGAAKTKAGVA